MSPNPQLKEKLRRYCDQFGLDIPQSDDEWQRLVDRLMNVGILSKEDIQTDGL